MSVLNYAYSVPFPKDTKITWEQAFEAMRIKARAPGKFVPAITQCEVLEETPVYIKRKVAMKNGMEMTEDVSLYKPSLVAFKSNTGVIINNLISEDASGALSLTFTFVFPLPGVEPGSDAEAEKVEEMKAIAKGAVEQSLKATLEMFEEGKLN